MKTIMRIEKKSMIRIIFKKKKKNYKMNMITLVTIIKIALIILSRANNLYEN